MVAARLWWMRYLGKRPWGKVGRSSRRASYQQGSPLNNRHHQGALWFRMQVQFWERNLGGLLPHPRQEGHAVPGVWLQPHKQTQEGLGWQPATPPSGPWS